MSNDNIHNNRIASMFPKPEPILKPYRDFALIVHDEEIQNTEGTGKTLEDAIAHAVQMVKSSSKIHREFREHDWENDHRAACFDDVMIWEQGRCLAIVRSRPGSEVDAKRQSPGQEPLVIRLDDQAAAEAIEPLSGPYREYRFTTNDEPLGGTSPEGGSLERAIETALRTCRNESNDVAIWHEGELCAVIKPAASGGKPTVIRMDGGHATSA